MKKLQYMKRMLLDWNKSTFGNIKENKKKIWEEIQHIDKAVEVNECIGKISTLRKKVLIGDLDMILRGEKIHWKQRPSVSG